MFCCSSPRPRGWGYGGSTPALLRTPDPSASASPSQSSVPEAELTLFSCLPRHRERGMNRNGNNKWAVDKAASAGVTARLRRGGGCGVSGVQTGLE